MILLSLVSKNVSKKIDMNSTIEIGRYGVISEGSFPDLEITVTSAIFKKSGNLF